VLPAVDAFCRILDANPSDLRDVSWEDVGTVFARVQRRARRSDP